ncbi:transmembrane protein 61 [Callorhinchus milii]|uniref:transmembrane protein 61 n=1 Tax=Callorhinchus milii TaxID=7868 RepID=UPI001C3F8D48|nr:transmembrane protein 61 [Callorhinchus milii]
MAYDHMSNRFIIGGVVLLVSGSVCFAWWSDDQLQPTKVPATSPNPEMVAAPQRASSNPLLKSISILFCLIGAVLLFFGLLRTMKVNRQMSRGYRDWNRIRLYSNALEWRAKYRPSGPDNLRVPSYIEALNSRPEVMVVSSNPQRSQQSKDPELPPSYETLMGITRVRLSPCRRCMPDGDLSQTAVAQIVLQQEERPSSLTYTTPPPSYENLHAQTEQ